jgi:hypothetical protein
MTIITPETEFQVDLTKHFHAPSLPREISLDTDHVAADSWPDLLERTHRLGKEHGLSIAHDRLTKRLRRSKIFTGNERSIAVPLFPFGIHSLKYLVDGLEDVMHIHTHTKHPEVAHLKTTSFTDEDINNFLKYSGKAKLMLDHGGAHLLLGSPDDFSDFQKIDFVDSALNKAGTEFQTMHEILIEVANKLAPFGIRYFFSDDPAPQKGKVNFIDVRYADSLKA